MLRCDLGKLNRISGKSSRYVSFPLPPCGAAAFLMTLFLSLSLSSTLFREDAAAAGGNDDYKKGGGGEEVAKELTLKVFPPFLGTKLG